MSFCKEKKVQKVHFETIFVMNVLHIYHSSGYQRINSFKAQDRQEYCRQKDRIYSVSLVRSQKLQLKTTELPGSLFELCILKTHFKATSK